MHRSLRLLGPGFLVAGLVLLGYSLRTGAATLYLVVVVPVVSGSGPGFYLATVLLVLGILLLPLSFAAVRATSEDEESTSAAPPSAGGVLLVGPVPIFFGSWRKNPPISYRWAVALGIVLVAVVLLVLWGFSVF